MRLTLRQLQIFVAVAETGSTTAAAERIALSQSATSAALNELERLLATRLFDRLGKRLLLNDSGRSLLPQARWVLDGANGIEGRFGSSLEAQTLQIHVGTSTMIGNYLMPGIIASYGDANSAAQLKVDIGNTQEVIQAVAGFNVDIGFIEGPCHEPQLKVIPWRLDELVIVCAPGYELAQARSGSKVSLKRLGGARWLLREAGSGTREAVEQALLPHLHHLQTGVQLGGTEAIKQAAAEGLGLSCLSRCVVEDFVALGRLIILKTVLPALTRRLSLIHHEKKYLSAGLTGFIGHCLMPDRL